jgi:D-alanine transaminase
MGMESQGEILYLNGAFMPLADGRISIEDRGFELGDGIYEVIKITNSRLLWLADHLERLERSLAAIRLSEALDGHALETVLPDLVARSGLDQGMVYVQVTRGYAPREFVFPAAPHPTVLAYARAFPAPVADDIIRGTVLHPVDDLRWAHCDIKSTNLLAAVLAKEEARGAGADEALFMAPDGLVREGGSSNVFAVIGGVLRTHPLSNRILGGITRKHVIEIARRLGFPVEERAFTLEELAAEPVEGAEVFTASTLKDMLPVVRIADRAVGTGRPGRVTLRTLDAMRQEQALAVGAAAPAPLLG